MLCHEHAASRKLPELDPEDSFEKMVEDKINEKFAAQARKQQAAARRRQAAESTAFFLGLSGSKVPQVEQDFKERLQQLCLDMDGPSRFCLPCDIKESVHSKPSSYHHIHALAYATGRRPPRIERGDVCQCTGRCGEDCLNRLLYVECVGDQGDKKSNCNVGLGCGNRQLSQRNFPKSQVKREHGRGWGLVVKEKVTKGTLVQEYIGEVVDAKTKEERLLEWEVGLQFERISAPLLHSLRFSHAIFINGHSEIIPMIQTSI